MLLCSNEDEAWHVIDYLIKNNVSLNVQNKHNETKIHIARYGCNDLIKYMCEFCANLDVQNDVTLYSIIIIIILYNKQKKLKI